MENKEHPDNSPAKMAFRKGFLFGFYDENGPKTPDELKRHNPHPVGTEEHTAWEEGYYSNM